MNPENEKGMKREGGERRGKGGGRLGLKNELSICFGYLFSKTAQG